MSLFKHAFVRGINDELVRLGYVRYPTKEAADAVADAVADQALPQEPAAQPVPAETAADVAATLVDAANTLVSETGMGEQPAPAEEELKTSAAEDFDTRAYKQAEAVMIKAAEGSNYVGGDQGNAADQAAQTDFTAQLDNQLRPQGYANMGVAGVGQTDTNLGRDASTQVGREEPHPVMPGETPPGTNSVIDQSKGASLRSIIQKIASGSNFVGGDQGNTPAQAATTDFTAKLDQLQRPGNYAEGARGQGWGSVPASAVIGTEQPHPHKPGETPSGSNSIIAASKSAAEDPYLSLFKKTAEEVAAHLPGNLGEDEKISHIRRLMGLNDSERTEYIAMLHKDAGATDAQAIEVAQKHASESGARRSRYQGNPGRKNRTHENQKMAGELPPALAAVVEAKKDEKKNGDGDEKKEDESPTHEAKEPAGHEAKEKEEGGEKKEGHDLLARIRRIAQGARA